MKWTFETDDVARPLAPGEYGVSEITRRVMYWDSDFDRNTESYYFPFPLNVQCEGFTPVKEVK